MSLVAPSRRTLLTSAAWTVPAVSLASTSPAYAASACVDALWEFRFEESGWAAAAAPEAPFYARRVGQALPLRRVGADASAALEGNERVEAITLTASAATYGRSVPWNLNESGNRLFNMEVTQATGGVGGTERQGLGLLQSYPGVPAGGGVTDSDYQEITFTFSRPVNDLEFDICDIDTAAPQYVDLVSVSVPPTSVVRRPGVVGDGTAVSPWRTDPVEPTQQVSNVTGDRNVRVKYDSVQSFTVRFWNGVTTGLSGSGQHGIFINNIAFRANTCQ